MAQNVAESERELSQPRALHVERTESGALYTSQTYMCSIILLLLSNEQYVCSVRSPNSKINNCPPSRRES